MHFHTDLFQEIDDEGNLCTIPLLMKGFVPYLGKLKLFTLHLIRILN